MSFLTDLVEGHTDKLGTDLSHAGSSFANHPMEWAEVGGAAALGAAPFLLPELGGLLGGGAGAEAGGGLFGGLGGLFGGGSSAAVDAGGGLLTNAAGETLGAIDPLAQGAGGITDIGSANSIASAEGAFPSFSQAAPGSSFSLGNAGLDPSITAAYGGAPGVPAGASVPGAASGASPFGFASTEAEQFGATTGAAPSGGGGFFSNITNSLMHPTLPGVAQGAGALAAGGGLAMNMMRGNQSGGPNAQALSQQAALESQQGQQLMSYLKNGTLPPALKAQMDQAMAAEKARIMSRYPAGTTPATNSSMAQDLNNMQTNAVAAMAQAQIELLNTGLKETGMSTQIYDILVKMDESHSQDLMKSIANFAGALGGSGFGAMQKVAA